MSKTVAIVHGWAEGPWQTKEFRQQLHASGLEITEDLSKADVIIGHSLGCYLIPPSEHVKLIVLIGLPYWPGRSMASGVARKLKREVEHHRRNKDLRWWLNKIAHNTWYILTKPQMSYYVITRTKDQYLPDGKQCKVLLVRPSDDTLSHPNIIKTLPLARNYKLLELPGAHDDCWIKPAPYVDLLLKELSQ